MDIHIKQNTLRVITSISMLVVFVSSLPIAFVPLNVIDNLLQVFLLEPVYTLLLFSAVYDEANGVFESYIMLAIVIILMAAVLTEKPPCRANRFIGAGFPRFNRFDRYTHHLGKSNLRHTKAETDVFDFFRAEIGNRANRAFCSPCRNIFFFVFDCFI